MSASPLNLARVAHEIAIMRGTAALREIHCLRERVRPDPSPSRSAGLVRPLRG